MLDEVSVCYCNVEDVYIIAFEEEDIFPEPVPDAPRLKPHTEAWRKEDRWEMFTHGVCALRQGNGYCMKQLALTGWHMSYPPTNEDFTWLLQRAADKMKRMAQEVTAHTPNSQWARQNFYAAKVLEEQKDDLVHALIEARPIALR
jgi:hypothetical protein